MGCRGIGASVQGADSPEGSGFWVGVQAALRDLGYWVGVRAALQDLVSGLGSSHTSHVYKAGFTCTVKQASHAQLGRLHMHSYQASHAQLGLDSFGLYGIGQARVQAASCRPAPRHASHVQLGLGSLGQAPTAPCLDLAWPAPDLPRPWPGPVCVQV